MVRFAFRERNAHRLYALIDPENVGSYKLAERIGFRREGHQKCAQLVRGEWRDSLVYGLLESDIDGLVASESRPG